MKIKSFTKKAICVAVLAGTSVGASALTPDHIYDLGSVYADPINGPTSKAFEYDVAAAGDFLDYLKFSLPDSNGGTVSTLFASDYGLLAVLKFATVTLVRDPNGVPGSGDETVLPSFLFSGGDKFKSLNYQLPLEVGSYYLSVMGVASGLGPILPPEFGGPLPAGKYNGSISVLAPPIPEPESYAMFLAGLGLMGVIVRRRTRSQS